MMKSKRLLVESESFITRVCSFTIPKSTNVKPYATFCTTVPASCFATPALQETPTRGSKRSISNTPQSFSSSLPRLTYHLRSLLPAVVTLQFYSLPHSPVCLCDLGFTFLHPPSLPLHYNQPQSHHISDIRRFGGGQPSHLVTFQHLHTPPKTGSFSRLFSHKKTLLTSLITQRSKPFSTPH